MNNKIRDIIEKLRRKPNPLLNYTSLRAWKQQEKRFIDQALKEIEELIHDKVNTAIFAMKSKEAINKVMGSTRLSEEEIREIAFDTIFHDADEESLIWFGDTSTNIAKAICKAQEAQKVKKLTKNDIILLALDAGFKLSTAYGQGTNKLMPVSDSDTLFEFYKKIQKGVKS